MRCEEEHGYSKMVVGECNINEWWKGADRICGRCIQRGI